MNGEDVRAAYRFLNHGAYGLTEVRLVGPEHGQASSIYVTNEDEFVAVCAKANGKCAVYSGINSRSATTRGAGSDNDVCVVQAVILDLDPFRPKDTASTDEQLAAAIALGNTVADWLVSKNLKRPVVVSSGNGCQLWMAIPPVVITENNRKEMTAKSKVFETKVRNKFQTNDIKVDSIFNLSRVIRVVGTANVKGPNNADRPHRLSRSLTPFFRDEDPKLLATIMTLEAEEIPDSTPVAVAGVKPSKELGTLLETMLSANPKLNDLFHGRGKDHGDPTSSGYDASLAAALAAKGLSANQIATVLWHRPDGKARRKGLRYIRTTIAAAMKAVSTTNTKTTSQASGKPETMKKDGGADFRHAAHDPQHRPAPAPKPEPAAHEHDDTTGFTVTGVLIYTSIPPVFELAIDGRKMRLQTSELLSPKKFETAFVETFHRIPTMPDRKRWTRQVNRLLKRAVKIEQPSEASPEMFLKLEARRIIENLPVGTGLGDLDHGKAVLVDGRRTFLLRTVRQVLHETVESVSVRDLAVYLRDLGYVPERPLFDGKQVRCWLAAKTRPTTPAVSAHPVTSDTSDVATIKDTTTPLPRASNDA